MKHLNKNKELSRRFKLTVYDTKDKFYPYYVEEWDDTCSIEDLIRHQKNAEMVPCIS